MSKCTENGFCSCFNPENGNNGMNATAQSLLERIRSLSFVKAELELYLDTHPRCRVALDYYYQTVDALTKLTDEYQAKYGPLTAMGSTGNEEWAWVREPWPWQREADVNKIKRMGESK